VESKEKEMWTVKCFGGTFAKLRKTSICIVISIKPTRLSNFSNLFWNETLHVSDISSVRHQELFTVHSAMVHVIQTAFVQQDQDRLVYQFHPDPVLKLSTNLYDIYHC
jgi:prephenate dehydrogenase